MTSVNDPPVANDDNETTSQNTALENFNVIDDDSASAGGVISIIGNTEAANGTVTDNADGTFTYNPETDFNGVDSFTYTIKEDSTNLTDTGTGKCCWMLGGDCSLDLTPPFSTEC